MAWCIEPPPTWSREAHFKALHDNEAVGILVDQNASLEEGTFVDFFGVPACAGTGFVKLAAHSDAVVIPGFALWMEQEQRYVLRFCPPVEITGDVQRDTQALHRQLEAVIRQYPDQWLWIHRFPPAPLLHAGGEVLGHLAGAAASFSSNYRYFRGDVSIWKFRLPTCQEPCGSAQS